MQMLLVALSRRMCCSRVCRASRYALLPSASTLTPTKRPGKDRSKPLRTAMKPACGPPNPIGTPKRCEEPTAMSAPNSPGDFRSVNANKSVVTPIKMPASFAALIAGSKLRIFPLLPG